MKFRNKVTGMVVDIPSVAKGDWEPVKAPAPVAVKPKVTENKEVEEKPVKKTRKVSK